MNRYARYSTDQLPSRPALGAFVSGIRDDFWSDGSVRRMTPAKLARVLREAEDGDIAQQAELFDEMELDPQLLGAYLKRRRSILTRRFELVPADATSRAGDAVALCSEMLKAMPGWRSALFHLQDAIGRGFAVLQIVWDLQGSRFVPARLQWWKQRDFILDKESPEGLRVLTDSARASGEPLAAGGWIVHRFGAKTGALGEAALFRALAWPWLIKKFSLKDWAIFNEAYGQPRRVGTYPRNAAPEELAAIIKAVRLLGRDAAAVIPEGAKLELLTVDRAAKDLPFPDIIDRVDRYMTKLILGQTLTTEASDRGTQALGVVHGQVQDELTDGDADELAETIRDQLLTPIVRFNLGAEHPIPLVRFARQTNEDLNTRVDVDSKLVAMGLKLSEKQLREVYGRVAPVDAADAIEGRPELVRLEPAPLPTDTRLSVESPTRTIESFLAEKGTQAVQLEVVQLTPPELQNTKGQ